MLELLDTPEANLWQGFNIDSDPRMRRLGVDPPNDEDDDDAGCAKEGTRMYTEGYDKTTVVCDDSWVFPDKLNCNDLGDKLTDDFATVGHLVLHEYTHWDWLLKDIIGGEVVDEHGLLKHSGYGLENAYHKLDKEYALLNANSYAWFATETMWSTICKKDYKEPSDDDESDDDDDDEEDDD